MKYDSRIKPFAADVAARRNFEGHNVFGERYVLHDRDVYAVYSYGYHCPLLFHDSVKDLWYVSNGTHEGGITTRQLEHAIRHLDADKLVPVPLELSIKVLSQFRRIVNVQQKAA